MELSGRLNFCPHFSRQEGGRSYQGTWHDQEGQLHQKRVHVLHALWKILNNCWSVFVLSLIYISYRWPPFNVRNVSLSRLCSSLLIPLWGIDTANIRTNFHKYHTWIYDSSINLQACLANSMADEAIMGLDKASKGYSAQKGAKSCSHCSKA